MEHFNRSLKGRGINWHPPQNQCNWVPFWTNVLALSLKEETIHKRVYVCMITAYSSLNIRTANIYCLGFFKVEEIRKVVDSELGFAVDLPYRKNESKVSDILAPNFTTQLQPKFS